MEHTDILNILLALNAVQVMFNFFVLPMVIKQGKELTEVKTRCGIYHYNVKSNGG